MEKTQNFLFKRFSRIGLHTDEIRFLINDLENYFSERKDYSIDQLNNEIESLGWGIQVIDQALYKDILSCFENLHQRNRHGNG